MEEKVFPAGAVAPVLEESFIEARLHTDIPENKSLLDLQLDMTGSLARPIYVVEDPATGQRAMSEMKAAFLGAERFAEFLRTAREKVALAGTPRQEQVASAQSE